MIAPELLRPGLGVFVRGEAQTIFVLDRPVGSDCWLVHVLCMPKLGWVESALSFEPVWPAWRERPAGWLPTATGRAA